MQEFDFYHIVVFVFYLVCLVHILGNAWMAVYPQQIHHVLAIHTDS